MSFSRDQMIKALKGEVVPHLRDLRFKGSFPHFRRRLADRIDLLTFQFSSWGGKFIIEIGQCGPEGYTTSSGKETAPEKVKAWDLHYRNRTRVHAGLGSDRERWFEFEGNQSDDDFRQTAVAVVPYLDVAEQMLRSLELLAKTEGNDA